MVGITSYGAYVPMLRLPLAAIGGGAAKPGGPEKAVANWDEDCVTMGVAAAIDCLRGLDRAVVDAVIFASSSFHSTQSSPNKSRPRPQPPRSPVSGQEGGRHERPTQH